MYLIVVGAEPEGLHLIDFAIRDGYEVTLVEPDPDKARKVHSDSCGWDAWKSFRSWLSWSGR